MSTNLNIEFDDKKFNINLQAWAEKFDVDVERMTLAFVSRVFENIVRRTPVGDPLLWKNPDAAPHGYIGGNARNNWRCSINDVIDRVENAPGGSEDTVLQDVSSTVARGQLGDTFYLQNSVPYIRRLEYDGWSSQAPAGMVAITFAEAAMHMEQAKSEILSGGDRQ